MKVSRFAVKVAPILLLVLSNQAQARLVSVLSYQEMLAKSDLVVIADPISKTTDTKEEAFFPGILLQEKDGKQSRINSIGVETVFAVSAVLKGDTSLKRFTLHHYREGRSADKSNGKVLIEELNGPNLVRFDPSDVSKRSSYLLFLVRELDGRFAPIGGQSDPGMKAISPIPFDLH